MITKPTWDAWCEKVGQRSPRERVLMTLVGLFLIVMAFYSASWDPLTQQWSHLKQQKLSLQQQNIELASQVKSIEQELAQDPNSVLRDKIQVVNRRLVQVNQSLAAQMASLIPADEMAATLQQILSQSGALQLESLSSLKPEPILPEKSEFNFYRHGVKLVLKGQFGKIYAFLVQLESLPQHFYWQRVSYKVDKYPDAVVEITIFTLSNNKEFIRG